MDDLAAAFGGQGVRGAADERRELGGVVGDDAAGDDGTGGVEKVDHVAGLEIAGDGGDAGGEKGTAAADHGGDGARVEVQRAGGVGGVAEPEAAGGEAAAGGG